MAERDVPIKVNERPVVLEADDATGLQIKEQAIQQGVPIQPDFLLSEELGGQRTRIIGDGDRIEVRPSTEFLAIPPDDNS